MSKNIPAIARFLLKAREVDSCWVWEYDLNNYGYGVFFYEGKSRRAHKWAYEYFVGPVPDGRVLDHLCKNKACVNPWHLDAVSSRENIMRDDTPARRNHRKTHCKRDHEFTPENTFINKKGSRVCRACQRMHTRMSKLRRNKTDGSM